MSMSFKIQKIFPQWCYCCKYYLRSYIESGLCAACSQKLPWWDKEICGNCLEPILYCYNCKNQPAIYPIFTFVEPISSWLASFKYNKNFYVARLFQKLIKIWFVQNPQFLEKYDLIIPLPTHPYRFFLRGFNPAGHLIKNLFTKKKRTNIAYKTQWTKQQTTLEYQQRIQFLKKKVFSVSSEVKGKKILIFDDVVTTQSSVFNLAKEIQKKSALLLRWAHLHTEKKGG